MRPDRDRCHLTVMTTRRPTRTTHVYFEHNSFLIGESRFLGPSKNGYGAMTLGLISSLLLPPVVLLLPQVVLALPGFILPVALQKTNHSAESRTTYDLGGRKFPIFIYSVLVHKTDFIAIPWLFKVNTCLSFVQTVSTFQYCSTVAHLRPQQLFSSRATHSASGSPCRSALLSLFRP